jgi:hypothetical protein
MRYVLALLLAACSSSTSKMEAPTGCSTDADCKGARICVAGSCAEQQVVTVDGAPGATDDMDPQAPNADLTGSPPVDFAGQPKDLAQPKDLGPPDLYGACGYYYHPCCAGNVCVEGQCGMTSGIRICAP